MEVGYISFVFFYMLYEAFCCLKCCFRKCNCCERRMHKHEKFEKARKRLLEEKDILQIIGINRISRLLHKASLSPRQRESIRYFNKYVIRDVDI